MKTGKKTHWLRNTLLILAGCAIIGLILSVVLFAQDNNRTYVIGSLSFTFDGAQDGIAPNGYAFEVNEVGTDEVIEEALKQSGMSGRYEIADIQANLAVQGVFPEDLVKQVNRYNSLTDGSSDQAVSLVGYHPTVFRVTLYQDFDPSISKGDLTSLLQNILTCYRSWFVEHYSMASIDGIEAEVLDGYDYYQMLDILKNKLQQAQTFADEMAEKEDGLMLNGKGFSDMSLQFGTLITNDLDRLSANVTMNLLSKDEDRLISQYEFEIQELQNQVKTQQMLLTNLDLLISTYGKTGIIYLSNSATFNKVDTQSSKLYDNLVDIRNEISENIVSLNQQISDIENKLQTLQDTQEIEASETEEAADKINAEVQKAIKDAEKSEDEEEAEALDAVFSEATKEQKIMILESGISRLTEKTNASIDTMSQMVDVFNEQQINDLTLSQSSIRFKAPSVLSGSFIMLALKTCGPICALGFMVALVLIIISRTRKRIQNGVKSV